ncbi:MAG: cytochrome c3 family protein [Acidobacteriota bacterium]
MKLLRRLLILPALLALPLAAAEVKPVAAHPLTPAAAARPSSLAQVLASYYSAQELAQNVYLGSEFCLACHQDKGTFRDTQHAFALVQPRTQYSMIAKKGVVADVNRNGKDDFVDAMDFNAVSSNFDKYKPNAPKLSVENGTYFIQIGPTKMKVVAVRQWLEADRTWLQRFLVKIPASDGVNGYSRGNYVSGILFRGSTWQWESDGIEALYDASNQPKLPALPTIAQIVSAPAGGSFETCAGCHTTGIRNYQKVQGEWVMSPYVATLYNADDPTYFDYNGDGNMETMNIGCEACHGPGANHVLNTADRTRIVNPSRLTAAQQLDVCGQCHSRLKSLPNKTFSFPYNDQTMTQWTPGTDMAPFYANPATSYWPDGKTPKSTHMEFIAVKTSLHHTNPYEQLTCSECHDPHKATGAGQLVASRLNGNTKIKTSAEDNTLCLSCHATHGPFASVTVAMVADYAKNEEAIGKVVASHSNHPYAPERIMGLGRCIECHMPTAGLAPGNATGEYTVRSHTFQATAPELTLKYLSAGGMPSACGVTCHQSKVNVFKLGMDPTPTVWNSDYDKALATELQKYYGPGGKWWDTTPK